MDIRPLGAYEQALLVTDQYSPFNTITVIHLSRGPKPTLVGQALEIVQSRHPLLAARIDGSSQRPTFAAMTEPAVPFHWEPRQGDSRWLEIAHSEMSKRIEISQGPLFACYYLFDQGGQADLILKFHHSVADGTVVESFTHELLECCTQLETGIRASEQPRPVIYPPLETCLPEEFHGARRVLHVVNYASRQMMDELSFRWRMRLQEAPPLRGKSKLQLLTNQTPVSVTSGIAAQARRRGITITSVLHAALLIAVNRCIYRNQPAVMRDFVFADLRHYTEPPIPDHIFGCLISMLRYSVAINPERDIWQTAADLQAKIYQSFKRGDKFTAAFLSVPLMKTVTRLKRFRLGSTGLSYAASKTIQPAYGSIQVNGIHGFAPNIDLGPEIGAVVTLFNHQLYWGFTCFEADMSRTQASAIIETINDLLSSESGLQSLTGELDSP